MADKDAQWLKGAVEGELPRENVLFLRKGELEDYYPREIVLQFAEEMALKKARTKKKFQLRLA